MKFTKIIKLTLTLVVMLFVNSKVALSQESSGNIYSPYSMYGLGSLYTPGTATIQGMAGTSIAVRDPFNVNASNPASYSVAPMQSMLFSFGMAGNNNYLKSNSGQTSYNGFTLGDLSAQFRIAKNLGFGFNFSPYSSVGYSIGYIERNEDDILTDLGSIVYSYTGSGDVSLIKFGAGWKPVKGLSIGANMLYYFGSMNRLSYTTFYPSISYDTKYRATVTSLDNSINKIGFEVGVQYDVDLKHDRYLTLGAVYTPKLDAGLKTSRYLYTNTDNITDSVYLSNTNEKLVIPTKISAGIAYRSNKLSVAGDYIYQDWSESMDLDSNDNVKFNTMQTISVGAEYTPNRYDLRKGLKRWSYRFGAKTSTYYMTFNDKAVKEYSGTFGIGVPLQKNGGSKMNIAVEAGQRGTVSSGIVRDVFVKLNIGFSLFTTQEWFVRHKFK